MTVRGWQIFFLIGVVAALGLFWAFVGSAEITGTAAAGTLFLGILHALLTRPQQDVTAANWLAAAVQRMLNVTPVLKVVTVLLWIGLVSATLTWSQTTDIDGIVATAQGELPSDALVILRYGADQHGSTVTNKGEFHFKHVWLPRVLKATTSLEVRWRTAVVRVSDQARLRQKLVRIDLSPTESPFQVTYYDVGGHAIDFLLRGELDSRWENVLGGPAAIAPQLAVFPYLKNLIKSFSAPFREDQFEIGSGDTDDGQKLANANAGRPFFVGSWNTVSLTRLASSSDFDSVASGTEDWRATVSVESGPKANSAVFESSFWRYSKEEDLSSFDMSEADSLWERPWFKYFRAITGRGMPAQFAILLLQFDSCGGGWKVTFIPRQTKVRVVVIQNVSSQTISLGDFALRESADTSFRTIEADSSILNQVPQTRRPLLTTQKLLPGGKLLVPLALMYAFDEDDDKLRNGIETMSASDAATVSEQLSKVSEIKLADSEENSHSVPADKMLRYINGGTQEPDFARKYVFGPSARIEGLAVNGVSYPIRQRDEKQFVLLSGMAGGSCPYLYTRADENSKWIRERHILYGFNSALKEKSDITALSRFNGSLMVSEEDPEVSHIDLIEVLERLPSGEEHVIHFADALTSKRDGRRLDLRQGETHVFRLEHFQQAPGARYFVRSVGYYEPY